MASIRRKDKVAIAMLNEVLKAVDELAQSAKAEPKKFTLFRNASADAEKTLQTISTLMQAAQRITGHMMAGCGSSGAVLQEDFAQLAEIGAELLGEENSISAIYQSAIDDRLVWMGDVQEQGGENEDHRLAFVATRFGFMTSLDSNHCERNLREAYPFTSFAAADKAARRVFGSTPYAIVFNS